VVRDRKGAATGTRTRALNYLEMSLKRVVALAMGAVTVLSLAVPASATGSCAMDRINVLTFHVEAEAQRKTYRIGDTAKIDVTVTRPADEDPGGNGIPTPRPTSVPAEDVTVGAGAWVKQRYFYGFGPNTDKDGKSTIPVEIPSYARPGWVFVAVGAEKFVTTTVCWDIWEVGYAEDPRMFKIED
jgi:hypothetical protein